MWMKIVSCLILVIVLNCNRYLCGNVEFRGEPTRNIKISKNVTIHRNGYGRLLGMLSLLRGFHHRRHIYRNPYVQQQHWRASFEFELKPHTIFENEIPPSTYFPSHNGVSNSGIGSNSIDSIFHFGNNDKQSSLTIGGSNQITNAIKGPDERDEIPIFESQPDRVVNKDANNSEIVVNATESEEKSERVLRHAIQSRAGEAPDEDENVDIVSTTPNIENNETTDTTQSSTIPQTTVSTETETVTETATTVRSESSTTVSNNEMDSTPVTFPSEWLGYYDFGIHKPEFIQNIEFTTDYPSQVVSEDIRYVTYKTPFKPSLPDYTNAYSSDFFVPFRYF